MHGACYSTKNIFSEGIQKLLDLSTKCVEKDGDYIEK
jgi:hypothetical protein